MSNKERCGKCDACKAADEHAGRGLTDPCTVITAVKWKWPSNWPLILDHMEWSLNGCFMVEWIGTWYGIETDGYIHT